MNDIEQAEVDMYDDQVKFRQTLLTQIYSLWTLFFIQIKYVLDFHLEFIKFAMEKDETIKAELLTKLLEEAAPQNFKHFCSTTVIKTNKVTLWIAYTVANVYAI